jgi:hypothetical protein
LASQRRAEAAVATLWRALFLGLNLPESLAAT